MYSRVCPATAFTEWLQACPTHIAPRRFARTRTKAYIVAVGLSLGTPKKVQAMIAWVRVWAMRLGAMCRLSVSKDPPRAQLPKRATEAVRRPRPEVVRKSMCSQSRVATNKTIMCFSGYARLAHPPL